MNKKTYKNFGDAVDELRMEAGLSYDRMSLEIGIAQSYLYHIINRRKASAPKDEYIEKIAEFFHITPYYFYEYRLRRIEDFIDVNRKFLDHCLRQAKRIVKKPSAKPEETLEEFEEFEEEVETKVSGSKKNR